MLAHRVTNDCAPTPATSRVSMSRLWHVRGLAFSELPEWFCCEVLAGRPELGRPVHVRPQRCREVPWSLALLYLLCVSRQCARYSFSTSLISARPNDFMNPFYRGKKASKTFFQGSILQHFYPQSHFSRFFLFPLPPLPSGRCNLHLRL